MDDVVMADLNFEPPLALGGLIITLLAILAILFVVAVAVPAPLGIGFALALALGLVLLEHLFPRQHSVNHHLPPRVLKEKLHRVARSDEIGSTAREVGGGLQADCRAGDPFSDPDGCRGDIDGRVVVEQLVDLNVHTARPPSADAVVIVVIDYGAGPVAAAQPLLTKHHLDVRARRRDKCTPAARHTKLKLDGRDARARCRAHAAHQPGRHHLVARLPCPA
mmetsp:Transcript_34015/g.67733  ORF Transcript_34015/g.67733 Transcript_34015/m.67733 type:complete len:221 (+) Transcript_34015:209-871(+)